MRHIFIKLSVVVFSLFCINVQAGIIQVDQSSFVGNLFESFEEFQNPSSSVPIDIYNGNRAIFSGNASINGNNGSGFIVSDEIFAYDPFALSPIFINEVDGTKAAAVNNPTGLSNDNIFVDITFNSSITAFGGYFIGLIPPNQLGFNTATSFEFFNASNTLIDSVQLDFYSLLGNMTWAGFNATNNDQITRVRITGAQTAFDALQAQDNSIRPPVSVPEPSTVLLFVGALLMLQLRRK